MEKDAEGNNGKNSCGNMEKCATIIKVVKIDGKKAQIVLQDSPFHPSGGGQPGDTGVLFSDGFRAEVKDTHKIKDTDNEVNLNETLLELILINGRPETGMDVVAEVDAERNAILSRMHTGQHLFSRLQENSCKGLETVKAYIGTEESVIYVQYDDELTWESLFETESETVKAIRDDLPVESLFISREEAEKAPELKIKWERIHDERIRMVRIRGIDATACAGTHVAHTGEVGGFLITGFNGSAPNWEVRFTVHDEELVKEYSRTMRRLLREVGCRPDQLENVFARQRLENAALRQIADKVRPYVSIPWEVREIGGYPLYFAMLPGLTKELLSMPARNCAAEHPEAFCLVLLPGSAQDADAPFQFIILRGARLSADLSGFIKKFPELKAVGGGKADWVNGTTTQRHSSVWFDCLERFTTTV